MTKKVIFTLMLMSIVCVSIFSLNCGKKGPLKLEPEMLPKEAMNLKVFQVGENIRVMWDFQKLLADNKTELEPGKITKIQVYYSEKEILGGKFRKKSTLLRKLKMNDLTRYEDPRLSAALEKLSSSERKKRERFTYFVDIPFKIKDLTAKPHFFAIRYLYGKKKSPLSKVAFLVTNTPVKSIENLKVTREKKLIKLEWSKPQQDVSGMAVPNIAGYKVFRKMKTTAQQTDETADEPSDEAFQIISRGNILTEYYEDRDTGQDGEYQYYVSTVISNVIESAPSNVVSINVTDLYPPDIPVNLVSFRASDHMFLTWKAVPDKDLSHYRIYRKHAEKDEFTLVADNVTTNYYKDKKVQKGTLYFYSVTAVDERGNESEYSNIVEEQF
jgi:fibronectin type 3 domain-containing protein